MVTMVKDKKMFGISLHTALVGFCTALWFVVILSFSLQTSETSTASSDVFVGKGIEIANAVGNIASKKTVDISIFDMTIVVRKLAHIFNFTILGFWYTFLGYTIEKNSVLVVSMISCICGIASAVTDEFFQYFVPGRCAQITDIYLDFFGIVCGVGLFVLCVLILKKHQEYGDD